MSFKRVILISIALAFLLSESPALGAEWTPAPPASGAMSYGYRISDLSNAYNSGMSAMTDLGIRDAWGRGGTVICESAEDPKCQGNFAVDYISIFGTCEASTESFACIQSLKFRDVKAEFSNFSSDSKVFPQSTENLIPLGSSTEIWKATIDNAVYLFATKVSTGGVLSGAKTSSPSGALEIEVQQVKAVNCPSCYAGKRRIFTSPEGAAIGQDAGKEFLNSGQCFVASEKVCYESVPMDLDSKITLQLRIPTAWSHWYFGRISSPEVSQSAAYLKSGVSVRDVTLSAQPIEVPVVGEFTSDLNQVPEAMKKILSKGTNGIPLGMFTNLTGSLALAWDIGLAWTSVGDKANSTVTRWRLSAMSGMDSCAAKNSASTFSGLIYSNSLLFDSQAPSMVNGKITYKVAGRHFSETGETQRGFYGMLLSKDYAKCSYSGDLDNIKATISVTDAGTGDKEVIVSTITSDQSFLKFSASGFSYSTKIVSIKVEAKEVVAAPKPRTLLTITCKKGTKIVSKTAVTPKCPTGYKAIR